MKARNRTLETIGDFHHAHVEFFIPDADFYFFVYSDSWRPYR